MGDGEVRIKSAIDTSGVRKGVAWIRDQLTKLGDTTKTFTKSFASGFKDGFKNSFKQSANKVGDFGKKIMRLGKIALGLGSAVMVFNKMKSAIKDGMKEMAKVDDTTNANISAMKSSFEQLKYSLTSAFAPLANVIMPIITRVTQALSGMMNKVAQIMGALVGQKSVKQATYNYEDYAESIDNTAEASKKAKSYLTGLDEVNKKASTESTSGKSNGIAGAMKFEDVEIGANIISAVDKLKQKLEPFTQPIQNIIAKTKEWFASIDFEGILRKCAPFVDSVLSLINSIGACLEEFWNSVVLPLASWLIDNILPIIIDGWTGMIDAIKRIFDGFKQIFEAFRTGDLETLKNGIMNVILGIWDFIKAKLKMIWDVIVAFVKPIWNNIIKPCVDAIKNGIVNAFTWVSTKVKAIWNGIKSFFKTCINGIIGFINGMISGVVTGINAVINALNKINVTLPGYKWLGQYAGAKIGFNLSTITAPQIPKLASGAVIPPNREFMAVLGDQKNGNNIETPEALLRQIIREEGRGNSYTINATANRKTIFELVIDEGKRRQQQSGNNPFALA